MRLVLLGHAATAAVRTAAFPADEPLDARGRTDATTLAGRLRRVDDVRRGPSARCRETAELIGVGPAVVEPDLAGPDHGRWTGRSLAEVVTAEPDGVRAWTADPDARPHGGESLTDLTVRVGRWMDGLVRGAGDVLLAVVDPPVLRAAVVHATGAGSAALWRVDVAPLTLLTITAGPGGWHLRSLRPALSTPDDELVQLAGS